MGKDAMHRRVNRGIWQRPFPGVLYLGAAEPDLRGEVLAAILSIRAGAAATGATVVWLHGLSNRPPQQIELVTLGQGGPPRRAGVTIRRSASLESSEILWIGAIPVTSPARTLIDRAGHAAFEQLEAETALMLRRHLVSPTKLRAAVDAAPRRTRGLASLRRISDQRHVAVTRSTNERRLRGLLRRAELDGADFNVRLGRRELDAYWPELRLGIEVDAFFTHGDEGTFGSDRWRDLDLGAQDIKVERVSDRALAERELAVAARLGAIIALRRLELDNR